MSGTGRLALWHNCAPGHEAAFEAWYKIEHLPERLSVPGFLRGRRWAARDGSPQYFTFYETAGPEVLTGRDYLARLEDPTPTTVRIMSGIMQNLSRTVCQVERTAGHLRGAWAVTAPATGGADPAKIAAEPGIARAEFWQAITESRALTEEEALRGGDDRIETCLVIETLRVADAERVAAGLPGARIWHLICEMCAEDVR